MKAPKGSRRQRVADLRVGDAIWFNALYQSRTGMLAREVVEGRVTDLCVAPVEPPGATSAEMVLEVRDRDGVVQRFHLASNEVVYLLATLESDAGEHAGPKSDAVGVDSAAVKGPTA